MQDNLYKASKYAMKAKKKRYNVAKFWLNEDKELDKIYNELKNQSYNFGKYKTFIINNNGVSRNISAAPFRDRVVHHAIIQIIEPLFEKSFIYDSYANRKNKGTKKALQRAKLYANRYKYVLKLDIKKYFPSIDHDLLLKSLLKKISCDKTIQLLEKLIRNSNKQEDALFYFRGDTLFTPYQREKGLPLGNHTSQFFGNVYLNEFDHYIKEVLQVKGYIRYVDDMLFFDNSKVFLEKLLPKIAYELSKYRLKLHPLKLKFLKTDKGFEFLGHNVFSSHFRLSSKSIRRARKKLHTVHFKYKYNRIDISMAKNKIFGIIGFFKIGNNYKISDELLSQTVLKRDVLEGNNLRGGSWNNNSNRLRSSNRNRNSAENSNNNNGFRVTRTSYA